MNAHANEPHQFPSSMKARFDAPLRNYFPPTFKRDFFEKPGIAGFVGRQRGLWDNQSSDGWETPRPGPSTMRP